MPLSYSVLETSTSSSLRSLLSDIFAESAIYHGEDFKLSSGFGAILRDSSSSSMGIALSLDSGCLKTSLCNKEELILSYEDAGKLVDAYFVHQCQPVVDKSQLDVLFQAAYGYRLDARVAHILNQYKADYSDDSSM